MKSKRYQTGETLLIDWSKAWEKSKEMMNKQPEETPFIDLSKEIKEGEEWYYWVGLAVGILISLLAFRIILNFDQQKITFENYQHLSPSEYIYQEAEKAGIDPVKVMMLVQAESNFDRYAVNYNAKTKSYDRSYWQFNNKFHPEISDACAYNLACSTEWGLKIIKENGFKEWSAGKFLKLDERG